MGQVNATEGGEQTLVNGESLGADNFNERKDFPNGRETMNCVKDKIDLLIEGCLLAKDSDSKVNANVSSSDERKMVRKSPKLLQQLEQEKYELMKNIVEATPNSKSGANEKKIEVQETQRDSAKLEKVQKDFIEGDDVNNKGARDSEKVEEQRPILNARDLLEDDRRYRESHISYSSGVIPTTIKIKTSSFSHAEKEQNRMSHSDGRTKMTTFQTFIDNVLDSSLKNKSLSSTEQSSLNSSSLQESSSSAQSSTKPTNLKSKVCSDSEKKLTNEAGLKIKLEDKWKDSTASVNMSQAQVLCLKDHIERVLEKSFNTDFHSPNNDQKSSREEQEERSLDRKSEHGSMAGKSPVKTGSSSATYNDQDSVCSPEGLVNSVLNQSMKNNKLVSSPKTSHNETDQSVKIIQNTPSRDSSDYHELRHSVTKEECFQFQLSGYQDGEHIMPQQKSPGNGQVSNAQRMEHVGYYPSPMMPHGSASPKGYPLHSRSDMRDSRQEYHYAHTLPPSAGFYSMDKNPTAQSSGIYSQDKNPTVQSSGIYSQDKNPTSQSSGIYSHVSSERSPGPSSSSQLRNQFSQSSPLPGVNGHSQMSPIGMFYPSPHTVIGQYSPAQPISDRVSSNNVYPASSQEMHSRDCRCPSCITKSSASKSAQNTHIMDQRKLETQIPQGQQQHYIPKLQSSLYPPTQPNHIVGSSNMGGLPHNNQMIDHPPAMMRPSNSTIPPGYVQYHPVHKLIPTNPPITSAREFSHGRAQLHEIQFKQESYPTKGITPRFGCSNSGNKSTLFSPKMENEQIMRMYPQSSQNLGYTGLKEERDFMMDPYGKEAYPSRPASLPTQDQEKNFSSGQFSFPQTSALPGSLSQAPVTDTSAIDLTSERKSFDLSNNDEEAPLDLSCKKAKLPERMRSQSFSVPSGQNSHLPVSVRKGLNGGKPLNTFIKQIENSVDKYCHDKVQAASNATSPSLRPSPSTGEASLSGTLSSYQRQSPHLSPPALTMPSQIAAAIQHAGLYSVNNGRGSIVMGYPGIVPSTQQNKTQIENGGVQTNSCLLTPKRSRSPVESEMSNNDSSRSGSNGKRNNVSKHEPIQNIIGSHDATDILYLICRLCSQTYGSPYGFRKHFRNQHGFEPRAEHTIVQTISATKSALQTPPQGPVAMQMPLSAVGGIPTSQAHPQTLAIPIVSSSEISSPSHLGMIIEQQNSGAGLYPSTEYSIGSCNKGSEHGRNLSPTNIVQNTDRDFDSTSNSSAEKLKVDSEDMESVKYLECPECKKTFQLNDFGSYKRHCRQHSQMHMRANGPYLCTECHTSFPEMHLLREHMSNHVSDQSKGETATQQILVSGQITSHSGNNSVHSFPPEMAKSNDGSTKKAAISSSVVVGGVSTLLTSSVVQSEDCLGPVAMLPSNLITHSPAECPDSSWDSNDKKTKVLKEKLKDEKTEETSSTEGNDSGYSPSGGSGSNFDDKNSDSQSEQGCNGEPLNFRKSCDDSLTNNGKTEVNTASIEYRHKKFGGQRKRETMDNSPGDCSKPKISKTTDLVSTSTGEHSDSPSALSNVGSDVECLDSSQTDCKGLDGNRGNESNSNGTDIKGDNDHSQEESKLIVKIKCTGTSSKQEARHNLPFVWDRVTRSKVGRRSKP